MPTVNRKAIAATVAIALVVGLPVSTMVEKGVHYGADNRCFRAMPENAWGYTIEWNWSNVGWICAYKGRDYRPTGQERRIGLTDLI